MQIAILSARVGWHTDELCRALGERGHVGVVLSYENLVAKLGHTRAALTNDGAEILEADAVLARIIPDGSLEQIIYRVNALHWISARGILVMNDASTIERCVDKFYTTALLQEAGLDTPETVVCERPGEALAAVREMRDVVIKPLFGSMGIGMVRVSDNDTASRVVKALDQLRAVYYVQRAIEHDGCDVRVFVIGGHVLGAIERRAQDNEWRTNLARGGRATVCQLPAAWRDIALRATAAIGAEYAGVDLIPARDGRVFVLEVNGIPAWKGLQEATGIDVAGTIVEHLVDRVRSKHAVGPAAPK